MKLVLYSLILFGLFACNSEQKVKSKTPQVFSQPVLVEDDDWRFEGTENLVFVPENRLDPNSRLIGLSYFHFPAKGSASLPPVVFLGAGPGEPYSVDVFFKGRRAEAWRFELELVNQKRDVILINQRGNSDIPGLPIHDFRYRWEGGSLDQPFDMADRDIKRRSAYEDYIKRYTDSGIDLRGYDVMHFVDDIEEIRKIYNCPTIAFIGNSFASQWALAYIQKYPQHVDRAIFSGVEPIDNNYDDPQEIWKVLERIEKEALKDPEIAKNLPEIGLMNAFKAVIERLEKSPETVHLTIPEEEFDDDVVVGADDLRYSIINPWAKTYAEDAESWPKYISEMYNGDFRYLAYVSMGRTGRSSSLMINPLFNNSLGISVEREKQLNARAANKWLGNINSHYTATRDICPAPKVDPKFLKQIKHDFPIILIQGDMDLSTPYANATDLMGFLNKGHLVTVERGFHSAKRALFFEDSTVTKSIYQFMDLDFATSDFDTFKKTLPEVFTLDEFEFWPIGGKSLFEMSLE